MICKAVCVQNRVIMTNDVDVGVRQEISLISLFDVETVIGDVSLYKAP